MKLTDTLWTDVWSKDSYPPINPLPNPDGTENEPEFSLCMASFAYAMGEHFKEGMTILDYGCGSARFCNFMSRKLRDFVYYGIEKRSSSARWGELEINTAQYRFQHDPRIKLGFIEEDIEQEAINNADVALLLSIFTHMSIEETKRTMEKLMPIARRGGKIVFSVIHGDEYQLVGSKIYGFDNFYNVVYNTPQQIQNLGDELEANITLQDTYVSPLRGGQKSPTISFDDGCMVSMPTSNATPYYAYTHSIYALTA